MMMKTIKRLFSKRYMSWNEYSERVKFLNMFHWQQSVRRESIKNL